VFFSLVVGPLKCPHGEFCSRAVRSSNVSCTPRPQPCIEAALLAIFPHLFFFFLRSPVLPRSTFTTGRIVLAESLFPGVSAVRRRVLEELKAATRLKGTELKAFFWIIHSRFPPSRNRFSFVSASINLLLPGDFTRWFPLPLFRMLNRPERVFPRHSTLRFIVNSLQEDRVSVSSIFLSWPGGLNMAGTREISLF